MAAFVMTGSDIAEVQNVINACMIAMDEGDVDWFADCYVADGSCTINKTSTLKTGREELKGLSVFALLVMVNVLTLAIGRLLVEVKSYQLVYIEIY